MNKIDLPGAEPVRVSQEIEEVGEQKGITLPIKKKRDYVTYKKKGITFIRWVFWFYLMTCMVGELFKLYRLRLFETFPLVSIYTEKYIQHCKILLFEILFHFTYLFIFRWIRIATFFLH